MTVVEWAHHQRQTQNWETCNDANCVATAAGPFSSKNYIIYIYIFIISPLLYCFHRKIHSIKILESKFLKSMKQMHINVYKIDIKMRARLCFVIMANRCIADISTKFSGCHNDSLQKDSNRCTCCSLDTRKLQVRSTYNAYICKRWLHTTFIQQRPEIPH